MQYCAGQARSMHNVIASGRVLHRTNTELAQCKGEWHGTEWESLKHAQQLQQ